MLPPGCTATMSGLVKPPPADYTFFMPLVLWIAATLLLGQVDLGVADMEPYVFVERGETARGLYALVKLEDLEQIRNPNLDVILDAPWLPIEQRRKRLRRLDYEDPYPEPSSMRNRRIREGWLAHGGVEVDTPEGRIWVQETEYELAQRAEEMAAAVHGGGTAASVPPRRPVDDAGREPLGFWAEWGIQVGILGGAIVLTALVVWATMFRGP